MRRKCHLSLRGALTTAILLLFAGPHGACGHGEVHQVVAMITREIEAKPEDALLRMERATILAQSDHFEEALADLARVNVLEPANEMPRALRGSIYRRTGRLVEARAEQEAFLKKFPYHTLVRLDYCQTLEGLKEIQAARAELDRLIGEAQHPPPDAVAMRLRLTEGPDGAGAAEALRWLEGFLTKNPLPVFHEHALRLEIQLNRTADAVRRMDRMIAATPRPEAMLLRKAEYLIVSGDRPGAEAAAKEAAGAIARLPGHIRSTRACEALEARVRQILSPAS